MKVIIAPDKFKGSLSANEAAGAIRRGVEKASPDALVHLIPMADGGEGTVEALLDACDGDDHEVVVSGPLGDPVTARFGLLGDGKTVVLEMSSASGLVLVSADRRDVMRASTSGTGELMVEAVRAQRSTLRNLKPRDIRLIVAIGGSATNDGGAGMAQALGYRLLDADGIDLPPGGGSLGRLDRIIPPDVDPLSGVEVLVACDVENPLCGPKGASRIYGPQKGASPEQIEILDRNLARFAAIILRDLGIDVLDRPGSGAAGGLGAGLMAFAKGTLVPGVTLIIETVQLAERLRGADLCLTAEGAIDASSAFGKTAVGVARLARSLGVPTFVLAGSIGPGAADALLEGVDACFSICPGPISLDHAILNAAALLENAAEQAVRAFLAARRGRLPMTRPEPVGEFGLIAWIRERSRGGRGVGLGIGDDCASLSFRPGAEVLVTTDMLMDRRHFRLDEAGPEQVGYKVLAVNLSDIAAMAGVPVAAFVALALPKGTAVDVAKGLYSGMAPLLDRFGVTLAGGDTNAWDGPLVVTVTLIGEATERGAVRRSGAKAGDAVLVTGPLGGSILGRHLKPMPRIAEALALAEAATIHAMIDLSDGLAADLGHLLDESGGLGATLDAESIPVHADAFGLGGDSLGHALHDGEDFELCLTLAPEDADRLMANPPEGVTLHRVGTIDAEPGLRLRLGDGSVVGLEAKGFDHLAGGG